MNAPPPRGPVRPETRGPVMLVFEVAIGLVMVAVFAWFTGVAIEVVGIYSFWKDEGEAHAQRIVQQDLEYVAAAPSSLLVEDTVAFSHEVVRRVAQPYVAIGVIRWYQRHNGPAQQQIDRSTGTGQQALTRGLHNGTVYASRTMSRIALISMFVAQDVLLRMSIAIFALPAFALACLLGAVDGLVRRDLRRWGGGRESSFIYHHAKRYTVWSLTGGFGLYLAWPFGGFNPALMVLVFTVLVAATLSTTLAAFKKYV